MDTLDAYCGSVVVDRLYVHVLCASVDPHRILHIDTLFTSAAVALVGRFLPSLPQASIHDVALTAHFSGVQ